MEEDADVVGLDSLNDYYDVKLKADRLKQIEGRKRFSFLKLDLATGSRWLSFFRKKRSTSSSTWPPRPG